jgi:hypothetical protein
MVLQGPLVRRSLLLAHRVRVARARVPLRHRVLVGPALQPGLPVPRLLRVLVAVPAEAELPCRLPSMAEPGVRPTQS